MPGTDLCPFCLQIHVKTLIPNVTVFGNRAFRRQLRLSEVVKVVSDSIAALMKTRKNFLLFSFLKGTQKGNHVRTQQEGDHLQAMKEVLTESPPCWCPDL